MGDDMEEKRCYNRVLEYGEDSDSLPFDFYLFSDNSTLNTTVAMNN